MRILRALCLAFGLTILLAACASSSQVKSPAAEPAAPLVAGPTTVELAQNTAATSTAQIAAGQQVYSQDCAVCHGANLEGVSGPALTRTNLAAFSDASSLYDYASKQMPLTAPGSLSQQQYLDVIAYILNKDGVLPASTTLTAQNLGSIAISASAPTPTGVPSSPSPAQQAVVQAAQIPSVGTLLVTSNGYTLYNNSEDGPDHTSCTGICAQEWPPLTVPSGVHPLAGPGIPGTLGTFQRPDGSYQVTYSQPPTYDRVPLYTYFADLWPGDRNGNLVLERWNDILVSAAVAQTSTGPVATGTTAATAATGQGVAALGVADYLLHCSPCHGIQGQGVDAPALRNSPFIQSSTDQAIAQVIADGIGTARAEMPAWLEENGGALTAAQIDNVVAFLRTLQGVSPVPSPTPAPPQPTETPLPPGAPTPEPARPSMPGGPGAAATMIGSVSQGEPMFGMYCAICHGPEGVQGIPNPDSDDEAVPPLNPIDPTIANPDPKIFAYNVDLFVENGSIPEGEGPLLLMPPFGARNMLTQQQIADLIAYVMSVNGVTFSGTPAPSPTPAPISSPTPAPPATATPAPTASPQAPVASSQVKAGQQAFDQECAICHGVDLQGISGPPLTRAGIEHFGNAGSLLDFASKQMPLTAPGSLPAQQYDDIVAYILDRDGLLPTGTTLTAQNASSISLTATPAPASAIRGQPARLHDVPDLWAGIADWYGSGS